MLIGLQAEEVKKDERPGHNLVFLIDTSGSMFGSDRLDLVKRAFMLLLEELNPEDTVSIVTYASNDRVVLEGTPAADKTRIMEAISELEAHGSTNGSAGILRAYEIAAKYYREGGVNRILLATDGDLNVGVTSEGDLTRLVTEKKESGISLTCLGFGMGNYKDNKIEALADYGNGNCRYIDTIYEARKALVEEGGGTFITVAKDVKIQVDFNPAKVKGYRLIGYEDRVMAAEDFANDEKDGGEVGSGHRVTALYEIVPVGSEFDFGEVQSKYTDNGKDTGVTQDMLTVNIRAKAPDSDTSELYTYEFSIGDETESLSDNMKFAAAVVEVAMLLRDSEWVGTATYDSALELLRDCGSVKGDAYKEEFLYLVNLLNRGN
jgi:Ca-activated chloride channel family protein